MKYFVSILILFSALFSVSAEEVPEYLLDLADEYGNSTRVFSINDDDYEDENGNEFIVLKFRTFQDDTQEKPFGNYTLRITVQLTDRKTDTVVFAHTEESVKPIRAQSMRYYQGTEWEYRIPYGDMDRPKLSAYTIEFGFEKDGYFVLMSADYDKVDSVDEILNGGGREGKLTRTRQKHIWPR